MANSINVDITESGTELIVRIIIDDKQAAWITYNKEQLRSFIDVLEDMHGKLVETNVVKLEKKDADQGTNSKEIDRGDSGTDETA